MIVRIVSFNIEADAARMRRLWGACEDAEVIPGSYAPALGVGAYQWYRVTFKDAAQHDAAQKDGLL